VIPAGPLREKVAAAASRCGAAVVIGGEGVAGLPAGLPVGLPAGLPVLRARLVSEVPPAGPLVAFAGIGRPEKFRETLAAAGGEVVRLVAFPDHHRYGAAELRPLLADGVTVVTTPKDMVRVPPALRGRITAVGVRLDWIDSPEPLLERFA
jgi:tetraacyldisaccharide 4'-kinase